MSRKNDGGIMTKDLCTKSVALIFLAITGIYSSTSMAQEKPVPVTPADYMAKFEGEIGLWQVTNDVMQKPGEFTQLKFRVEISPVFDGRGIKSTWRTNDDNAFFGQVIRTYNPATGAVDQHYFAAKNSTWSARSQVINFHENGYSTAYSGADQYGKFDLRSKTTYLPQGGFDWTIERRYEGTDWFLVDRGEARPFTPSNQ